MYISDKFTSKRPLTMSTTVQRIHVEGATYIDITKPILLLRTVSFVNLPHKNKMKHCIPSDILFA